MTALTEFLLARYAEDEAAIRLAKCPQCLAYRNAPDDPATERLLADVAAKRRIVEQWLEGAARLDAEGRPAHLYDPATSILLKSHQRWLGILATAYADHPDFRPEWKP